MSGFDNEVVYCDNWDFRGVQPVVAQATSAGDIPIGTGGSPAIEVGTITSPGGSITVGYASPNITIDVVGGGTAIEQITVDNSTVPGTNPVLPLAGNVTITGGQVANASLANVIQTHSLAANSFAVTIQRSAAVAATDSTKNGVSHFDSASFDVDANGFVQLNGGGIAATSFDVQSNTGPGTDPVVPTAAGVVIVNGAVVANHSVVLETHSRAANAYNLEVQYATSAAATDGTKSGVAHFNSGQFTVDASGFVSASATGIATTITGDSGGALSPASNNWNILGRSGSKTAGSGSTLTINSPPFADQGGSTSVTLNSGSFSTAAITLTTPVTAGLLDGDLLQFVASTADVLTIQFAATQVGHIGNQASSAAGTFVSTAIGDSLTLRYQASTNDWWATSVVGNWTIN